MVVAFVVAAAAVVVVAAAVSSMQLLPLAVCFERPFAIVLTLLVETTVLLSMFEIDRLSIANQWAYRTTVHTIVYREHRKHRAAIVEPERVEHEKSTEHPGPRRPVPTQSSRAARLWSKRESPWRNLYWRELHRVRQRVSILDCAESIAKPIRDDAVQRTGWTCVLFSSV